MKLNTDSSDLLKNYIDQKVIDYEFGFKAMCCRSKTALINVFKEYFSFNQDSINLIWVAIRNNWEGIDTDQKKQTILRLEESYFIHKLTLYGGVIDNKFSSNNIFKNTHQLKKTMERLLEFGYVDEFIIGRDAIYVLNLEFYQKEVLELAKR